LEERLFWDLGFMFAENPDLYKRYRDAKHRVRWLALTD
jgi:hypothetical protein